MQDTNPAAAPIEGFIASRPQRRVRAHGIDLAVHEWGTPGSPVVVCLAGTGLSSAMFLGVEAALGGSWHGFSIDRRGHGLSDKPPAGYDFTDFVDDLQAVLDHLGLEHVTGLGHSAGATDILLAAAARPERWRAVIALEPALQDPRIPPNTGLSQSTWVESYERTLKRKASFPSFQAAVERFRKSPDFARVPAPLLQAYLRHATYERSDGSAILHATPDTIAQSSGYITQSFGQCWQPPAGKSDPFAALAALDIPVLLATTGHSGEQFKRAAAVAEALIPGIQREHVPGAGHMLPLEQPVLVAELVERMRRSPQ